MAKTQPPVEGQQQHKPLTKIEPGTPEMERYLAIGYPRIATVEKARAVIKERKEKPELWPYEVLEQAEAFLAAYEARPQVISAKPAHNRHKYT